MYTSWIKFAFLSESFDRIAKKAIFEKQNGIDFHGIRKLTHFFD